MIINGYFVGRFMYSYHNKLLPNTFNTIFITNRQVQTNNTRDAINYRPYFCRTNMKQFTILYLGPKLWDSLVSIATSSNEYLIERAITMN